MRTDASYTIRQLNKERQSLENQLRDARKQGDSIKIQAIEELIGSVETSVFNCKVEIGY